METQKNTSSIFVENGEEFTRVWFNKVLYFKAEGDGTRIQMKDSQITIPISLEQIETSLGEIFLRIMNPASGIKDMWKLLIRKH